MMQNLTSDEIVQRQLTLTTHRIHTLPVVVLCPIAAVTAAVSCAIFGVRTETDGRFRVMIWHLTWRTCGNFTSAGWSCQVAKPDALQPVDLVRLLKDLEVKISLLSTGLLLTRFAPDIVRWCDEVIVSLDGSREVHNTIRGVPRAYERLAEGIAASKPCSQPFGSRPAASPAAELF